MKESKKMNDTKEIVLKYNISNGKYYCPYLSITGRMCTDYHKPCDHTPLAKEQVIGKSYEETLGMIRKVCPYKISRNGDNGEKLVDLLLEIDKSF